MKPRRASLETVALSRSAGSSDPGSARAGLAGTLWRSLLQQGRLLRQRMNREAGIQLDRPDAADGSHAQNAMEPVRRCLMPAWRLTPRERVEPPRGRIRVTTPSPITYPRRAICSSKLTHLITCRAMIDRGRLRGHHIDGRRVAHLSHCARADWQSKVGKKQNASLPLNFA